MSLRERADRSGVTFFVHPIGHRTFPDYDKWHEGDYRDLLKLVKDLEMRPDDVYVAGYPKSGNHWVHETINMVMRQTTDYIPETLLEYILDAKSPQEFEDLKSRPSPRVLPSHLPLDLCPKQIAEKKCKVIYLVRNFKDMNVSMYTFIYILTKFIPYKGTWDDFMDIAFSPLGLCYGNWFEHVKGAEDYHKEHPDVPFHILCFELLKTDPVKEIEKLCRFLGKPTDLAAEIADKVSFQKMVPSLEQQGGKMENFNKYACEPGTAGLFRKGVIGDWKNSFTVAQSLQTDAIVKEKLPDSKIAEILEPFMKT